MVILCVYLAIKEIDMANAERFWNKIARKYSRDAIKDMASYEYTLGRTRSYLKPTDRGFRAGGGDVQYGDVIGG